MADPNTAAQDPIFWLHHSNIDRGWAHWQAGDGIAESDSVWLGQGFDFFTETGERVTMTVSEVIDHATDLSYRYDDEPPPIARGRRPGGPAVSRILPEEAAASELAASGPVALGGGVTSVSLPVTQEARETVRRLGAPEAESAARAQLTVEDIEAEHDPGVVYAIYLGFADDAGDPSSDRFVGYVIFFGASHLEHGEHKHAGISHAYDITEVLGRLQAEARWLETEPTVTFVPTSLEPLPARPAKQGSPLRLRCQAPGFGRVTITSG